jgi:chorismate mutase
MSITLPAESASTEANGLGDLRAELNRLDDALHDLLMRRAQVVARVAALKGSISIRPGREAEIVRRLLARHHGPLDPRAVVRIWRELLAGSNAMQTAFAVTVCDTDPACAYTQLAREHFGALTPVRVFGSPAQAIAEISAGSATVAVLPMPTDEEPPRAAWWTSLLYREDPRIHIVARLPFWGPRPEGAPRVEALAVAAIAPDESGQDRSLIGMEFPAELSRDRLLHALAAAGFDPGTVILRRESGDARACALADVAGLVGENDLRLAALGFVLRPPVVLGAYATPLNGEAG